MIARETRSPARVACEGPRATVCKSASLYRRARACPSPCLGRGNGFGWRAVFARVERSRGTGPRATVDEAAASLTRSGSGEPELQSLANRDNRVNPAHLWGTREIAGDRPPRYGPGRSSPRQAPFREQASPKLRSPASNLANRDNLEDPAHILLISR